MIKNRTFATNSTQRESIGFVFVVFQIEEALQQSGVDRSGTRNRHLQSCAATLNFQNYISTFETRSVLREHIDKLDQRMDEWYFVGGHFFRSG